MIKDLYSDNSTKIFRRCRQKFDWSYGTNKIEGVTFSNPGTRLGAAGHIALASFYGGKTPREALIEAYTAYAIQSQKDELEFSKLHQLLGMYFPYTRVNDRWQVLEVEKEFTYDRFLIRADLLVHTSKGQTWVVDHKFKKSHRLGHLDIDTQVSMYLYVLGKLDYPIDGFLLNILPTDTPGAAFPIRRLVSRSRNYLAQFEQDLYRQVDEMDRFLESPQPYRNHTDDCEFSCAFYQHCVLSMERKLNERRI